MVEVQKSIEVHPDWTKQTPDGWEERLRTSSPIVDLTSHLRFRFRSEAGQWEVYQCIPAVLLEPYRVQQLTVHWTSLPTDQQKGRQVLCSEYQHYMFRTYRVDARRFWVLQGPAGGTPVSYTEREKALLTMRGLPTEPVPMGVLPAVPFDDRAVQAILKRDDLLRAGNSLDRLASFRTAASQQADAQEAEMEYRAAFLAWLDESTAEQADIMKYILSKPELASYLGSAKTDETQYLHTWQDDYLKTGILPSMGQVASRRVNR